MLMRACYWWIHAKHLCLKVLSSSTVSPFASLLYILYYKHKNLIKVTQFCWLYIQEVESCCGLCLPNNPVVWCFPFNMVRCAEKWSSAVRPRDTHHPSTGNTFSCVCVCVNQYNNNTKYQAEMDLSDLVSLTFRIDNFLIYFMFFLLGEHFNSHIINDGVRHVSVLLLKFFVQSNHCPRLYTNCCRAPVELLLRKW